MAGRDVRHASVISSGLIVSDSVGVASLIRYCSSIGGAMSFTRLGCVLSNIEGGDIFVKHLAKKSVRVHGVNWCRSSIRWAVCLSLVG